MSRVLACVTALVLLGLAPVRAAAETVDLQLIFAADVSLSVRDTVFMLQRHGFASALLNPRTVDAIRSGPHRSIAICFVEFADETQHKVVGDWSVIRDEGDVSTFAVTLLTAPRSFKGYASLSGAIDFAVEQFKKGGFTAARRVLVVAADGTNAAGRPVTAARNAAVAAGITIDGLAIANVAPKWKHIEHTQPSEGLAAYFKANVIGGPGAFVAELNDASPLSVEDQMTQALQRAIRGEQERQKGPDYYKVEPR
jgi:hypothetical protein